ncbi:MAG: DUF1553 domain-containing protein [Planctomycetota bacterium]
MRTVGQVESSRPGPRPPEFPDLASDNTAIELAGGHLVVKDAAEDDTFAFTNGDAITIEAWIQVDRAKANQPVYVIGKGRTGSDHFPADNQNWALRVVQKLGSMRASFLFATEPSSNGSYWHRWTTYAGFDLNNGWHHVAISYRFGDPSSVRGYIDGVPSEGFWDMSGPTDLPPVVDDDEVWIGSGNGGKPSNSLQGRIDRIGIYRRQLGDQEIASFYRRLGGPRAILPQPELMPQLGDLTSGQVTLFLHESIPSHTRWLLDGETYPDQSVTTTLDSFLLPRLPIVYDGWGIRRDWKPPLLARMAADVRLPAGNHQILVRTRSLARLWIDDKKVAGNPVARKRGGNEERIRPVPPPPMPGGRRLGFSQQESIASFRIDSEQADRPLRVVLEWTVGDKDRRVQTGEVCIAIRPQGHQEFFVLAPGEIDSRRTLHDDAVRRQLLDTEKQLQHGDDHRRRVAAESRAEYWRDRHEHAREVVATRQVDPPPGNDQHSIDRFIAQKIQSARNSKLSDGDQAATFYGDVLPILRDKCVRCHGEKSQGGLRLDSREAVLAAGESELPAVVPGDPDESELIVRIRDGDMPPTEDGLSDREIQILQTWVRDGAPWPDPPVDQDRLVVSPSIDDITFLRRAFFDVVGVPPTQPEIDRFLNDPSPDRRFKLVDQLLEDDRYADNWVSLWLDLLAENPTLLNVSMGSTGPFRWYLYDSLRDNKPLDRMVTELILMRGSVARGGSAGFGIAGENDAPMAAKAHVLASTFLGVEMGCARCHDAPYHSVTQEDLFSLAAMLSRKPVVPPATSRVPDAFFENNPRQSLIRVSLPPYQEVAPEWPLADLIGMPDDGVERWVGDPNDARARLAALFTSPDNGRFSQVIVNHLWNRLIGAGIVQPVHDWEGAKPSHPKMLAWLGDELVAHEYDMQHVLRLILTSDLYSRTATGSNRDADADSRFFAAPDPRRMIAEQVVDSLFVATGQEMDVEELTFVHDNSHPMKKRLSLGKPSRAWMFAGMGNERDRPSLSMPQAQAVVDVLKAFGWTGTRQQPIPRRDVEPNVLQPGILANGDLSKNLSRAAWQSELADLARSVASVEDLVESLFLRFLTRKPTEVEQAFYTQALGQGFETRLVAVSDSKVPLPDPPLPVSTWTNHLLPEANEVQLERQSRVRRGPPVDPSLQSQWREVYEDAVWSLINHREFVWMP